ncbi:MAG TPA: inorganic pyrophosphatase Ppa [bacterium]|nr:inorganic pyrophosphatase Ppa [bacterium]
MEQMTLIARYQVEPYRASLDKLRQIAVSFTGSPRSHSDPGKVLLLNDPASQQAFFYEFRSADVLYAEEAPSLALEDGSTVSMVRLWVKKGATALRIIPFYVQDTARGLRDLL